MQLGATLVGVYHGYTSFSNVSARTFDQPGESGRLQIIKARMLAMLKIFDELGLEPEMKVLFGRFRLNKV
jgi:hypothetical protein